MKQKICIITGPWAKENKSVAFHCAIFFDISKNDNLFSPWIPKEKLPEYLSKIKLLILASEREGFPNIMLEAMAYGTPVLTKPVGAIPDVIWDEVT
ncbi:MAG TPA: glycosyltransferase [Methanolinea sp.]|nr:glycosyltransferase [Methanolinea sp.]